MRVDLKISDDPTNLYQDVMPSIGKGKLNLNNGFGRFKSIKVEFTECISISIYTKMAAISS